MFIQILCLSLLRINFLPTIVLLSFLNKLNDDLRENTYISYVHEVQTPGSENYDKGFVSDSMMNICTNSKMSKNPKPFEEALTLTGIFFHPISGINKHGLLFYKSNTFFSFITLILTNTLYRNHFFGSKNFDYFSESLKFSLFLISSTSDQLITKRIMGLQVSKQFFSTFHPSL